MIKLIFIIKAIIVLPVLFSSIFISLTVYRTFFKTIGYLAIKHKNIENNNYYIYVDNEVSNVKLRCTEDIYKNVIVDNKLAYGISYKWTTLSPSKGSLLYIDLNNTIDNRDEK